MLMLSNANASKTTWWPWIQEGPWHRRPKVVPRHAPGYAGHVKIKKIFTLFTSLPNKCSAHKYTSLEYRFCFLSIFNWNDPRYFDFLSSKNHFLPFLYKIFSLCSLHHQNSSSKLQIFKTIPLHLIFTPVNGFINANTKSLWRNAPPVDR